MVGCAYAAFVKRLIVGHEWKIPYEEAVYVTPHLVKGTRIPDIIHGDAMDVFGEMAEYILRLWIHQFVESVGYAAVCDFDRPYGADGTRLVVGRLYINGYEVFHLISETLSRTCSMSQRGVDVAPQMPIDAAPSNHVGSICDALLMRWERGLTLRHSL